MASRIQINNYSQRNTFIWANRYNTIVLTDTNATGSDIQLLQGMLIGRVAATGLAKQSISTATDGSQIPIGVLAVDTLVAAGTSANLTICIQGDVDYSMLVFGGSPADTVASKIYTNAGAAYLGTYGDLLNGLGVLPIVSTEMTYLDNQ
jgi:hypothetical protein